MNNIKENNHDILNKLINIIQQRKKNYMHNDSSYIANLFKKGPDSIIRKVCEENIELVLAYKNFYANYNDYRQINKNKKNLIHEFTDMFFHFLIALSYADLDLNHIKQELESRYGTSGLEEKKNRKK